MSDQLDSRIRDIVREDPRYDRRAYHFIFDVLDYTIVALGRHRMCGVDRHISVEELLEGVINYARHEFGPLACVVLEHWGLYRTEDIGEVVFNLIESGLLNRRQEDSREDFENGFSFRENLEIEPEIAWEQIA